MKKILEVTSILNLIVSIINQIFGRNEAAILGMCWVILIQIWIYRIEDKGNY